MSDFTPDWWDEPYPYPDWLDEPYPPDHTITWREHFARKQERIDYEDRMYEKHGPEWNEDRWYRKRGY